MTYIFFYELRAIIFPGIASVACLQFGIGRWQNEREVRVNDKDEDSKKDQKLPSSLHDDISATGSRIGTNQKESWRESPHASNDRSSVD